MAGPSVLASTGMGPGGPQAPTPPSWRSAAGAGSDDAPTLAQFQQYVKDGKIGYFIADAGRSGGPGDGSDSAASQISAWVAANFTVQTVGGATMYDLTR